MPLLNQSRSAALPRGDRAGHPNAGPAIKARDAMTEHGPSHPRNMTSDIACSEDSLNTIAAGFLADAADLGGTDSL